MELYALGIGGGMRMPSKKRTILLLRKSGMCFSRDNLLFLPKSGSRICDCYAVAVLLISSVVANLQLARSRSPTYIKSQPE